MRRCSGAGRHVRVVRAPPPPSSGEEKLTIKKIYDYACEMPPSRSAASPAALARWPDGISVCARVEQFIGKIKRFKRIAVRCEKTKQYDAALVALACVFILVKSVHAA
jgi:hypothetical protein